MLSELPEDLAPLPLTWKKMLNETAPGAKDKGRWPRHWRNTYDPARKRKGLYTPGSATIFVMAVRHGRTGWA